MKLLNIFINSNIRSIVRLGRLNILNSQKGFTLVELLLYSLLAGVILLSVSFLLLLLMSSRTKGETIAEVEQQGAYVMQLMTQTIRNATNITSPTIGTSGNSLTLVVPTPAKSPTVFDLSGSTLRVSEGSPATINNLTSSRISASSLTFQNLSRSGTDGIIRIQFTLTYVNSSGRNEYDFSKTFYGSASIR